MKYYLGVDIGKYKNAAILTDNSGMVLGKAITFPNNNTGWQELISHLNKNIDTIDYPSVQVGFEATGHYWLAFYLACKEKGFTITVLNPLEVKAFRNEGVRGNKTDTIDALKIAKLLRFGDFTKAHIPDTNLIALRQLTRLREDLVEMIKQLKQKCLAVLDMTFPEYQNLFNDVFGNTSRALLATANTPEGISQLSTTKLTNLLRKASRGRFTKEKAEQIKKTANQTLAVTVGLDVFSFSLEILLSQIENLQGQVDKLEEEISKRVENLNTTITSIPGIGKVLAGIIIAEIGDFNRLISKDGAEKLVALSGIDPKVKESGKYKGKTKMSKRGSPHFRCAVRQAAFVAVNVSHDPMFTKIYQNQINKGKHPEVALTHVERKMIHVIYSLLKSKKNYVPNI